MMKRFDVVKTVWLSNVELSNITGNKYIPEPNTTLNERFQIICYSDDNDKPLLNYYMLGASYDDLIDDNTIELDMIRHSPKDGIVYRPVPFRIVPISEDLTVSERSDYYLRSEEIVDGVECYVYYGKKISDLSDRPRVVEADMSSDDITIRKFEASNDIMYPNPTVGVSNHMDPLGLIGITSVINITLTTTDIEYIRDNINLLYPDLTDARIREVGLISGVEVDSGYGTTELSKAQVGMFIKSDYLLDDYIDPSGPDRITLNYELGDLLTMVTRG